VFCRAELPGEKLERLPGAVDFLLQDSTDDEVRRVREDGERCVGLRMREQGGWGQVVLALFEGCDGSWVSVDTGAAFCVPLQQVVEGCLGLGSLGYKPAVEVYHAQELSQALQCLWLLESLYRLYLGEWARASAGHQVAEEFYFVPPKHTLAWVNYDTKLFLT
jgi:hypothetical protein